jgi:hypothetical protein
MCPNIQCDEVKIFWVGTKHPLYRKNSESQSFCETKCNGRAVQSSLPGCQTPMPIGPDQMDWACPQWHVPLTWWLMKDKNIWLITYITYTLPITIPSIHTITQILKYIGIWPYAHTDKTQALFEGIPHLETRTRSFSSFHGLESTIQAHLLPRLADEKIPRFDLAWQAPAER